MCGAARHPSPPSPGGTGLSPRVRGSPHLVRSRPVEPRSIPACAGQPAGSNTRKCPASVYPRVCGAAHYRHTGARRPGGLSPRVRGSQPCDRYWMGCAGSIPACAGQPRASRPTLLAMRVYPRVCGAAGTGSPLARRRRGLSPRVRGSLLQVRGKEEVERSIPACAGQPHTIASLSCEIWVYPRVCGAAVLPWGLAQLAQGLSPRVRGSLLDLGLPCRKGGSIPACAGQPPTPAVAESTVTVYPRVCGAASSTQE